MNNTTNPLCKCGCNQLVTFNKALNRWNNYVCGSHFNRHKHILKNPSRYNKDIPFVCGCGCGKLTNWRKDNKWSLYVKGHNSKRPFKPKIVKLRKPRELKERPLCKCGCGNKVRFLSQSFLDNHFQMYHMKLAIERRNQALLNAPMCKCGCGKQVTIKHRQPLVYNDYVLGHHKVTEEFRQLMRIKAAEYYCPNIGKLEHDVFPELIKVSPYKIWCLENQKKTMCGYHLDGYIEELNLVIEVDENYHNHKLSKLKDPVRQQNIEAELLCRFFRITEQEWKKDFEEVKKRFINFINEICILKNLKI